MKNVLLAVTGSIAAYKSCDIVSKLSKKYNVKVIMTENSKKFVSPLTFKALTNNDVYYDQFDDKISHISLSKFSNILLIAPATANIISKIANGIADDLLSSTALAFTGEIYIAPAMNTNMYLNEATQENISKLKKRKNIHFIEPQSGILACKDEGIGKLANTDKIFNIIDLKLQENNILKDKKVLVLTGGTSEKIDTVRVLTNISSGKMGYNIAKSFLKFGAKTTLLSTKEIENYLPFENIIIKNDSKSIYNYIKDNYSKFDIIVNAAAISDITPKNTYDKKIKKDTLLVDDKLNIDFEITNDVLKYLGNNKLKNQIIIGFAAETDNIFENAQKKLKNKNVDYIILNDVSNKEIGFNSDYNEVYIISNEKNIKLEKDLKEKISDKILYEIFN